MKTKQNLHIHTVYADGKDKPEEIVLEAINKGFASIGFSEHTYLEFSDYPYQMTVEDMYCYRSEVLALKEKYKDKIEIFCGLEYDFFSDVPTEGFDYLIGAVHYLDFGDEKLGFDRGAKEVASYVQRNFGGDGLAFAKKYYETLQLLPTAGQFDILAHHDTVIKTNEILHFVDTSSKEYIRYGIEAIRELKGKIPLFEVNSGAIARGYNKTPYPQMEFLKEFKDCGFGAVITSDCHDKNYIDCYYKEMRELLLAAGFKSHFVLTENGFVEESL